MNFKAVDSNNDDIIDKSIDAVDLSVDEALQNVQTSVAVVADLNNEEIHPGDVVPDVSYLNANVPCQNQSDKAGKVNNVDVVFDDSIPVENNFVNPVLGFVEGNENVV